jgi:hypothetical protein
MKRVGIIEGGHPHGIDKRVIPPGQHWKVSRFDEVSVNATLQEGGCGVDAGHQHQFVALRIHI